MNGEKIINGLFVKIFRETVTVEVRKKVKFMREGRAVGYERKIR